MVKPEQYYRKRYERTCKEHTGMNHLPTWFQLSKERRQAIKQLIDEHDAMLQEMARVGKTS